MPSTNFPSQVPTPGPTVKPEYTNRLAERILEQASLAFAFLQVALCALTGLTVLRRRRALMRAQAKAFGVAKDKKGLRKAEEDRLGAQHWIDLFGVIPAVVEEKVGSRPHRRRA